ncbi:glycoside hydrolase family 99-like domain-containing protein [Paenibacillus sp. FSL H8-0261]|uniref:glycosyltransferase WbsX family protein n=1 Tax=Paenibacillus sp. FSL H8-0261 TaxID=2921381 RepID=UPI0032458726
MKIIAFYLPQFHTFPENDEWWGEGFTEWTTVRNAKPLFKEHNQPRVPYEENYYDLTKKENLRHQARMAKKYGVYGFCYYHYWFDGRMVMEKPAEIMLNDKEVDLPFCMCWANEDWTRAWANNSKEVLIGQTYGSREDWEQHFYYLLNFFKDERYIKEDGKPVFVIYRPEIIPTCVEMIDLWQELAVSNGFPGISFIYQQKFYNHLKEKSGDRFDYGIEYQPGTAFQYILDTKVKYILKRTLKRIFNKLHLPSNLLSSTTFSYDDVWNVILNTTPRDEKMIPGAFVDWDNTPRHKHRGQITLNATPQKFKLYLSKQIKRTREIYAKDILFMFAWNEWGEGGHLEPDQKNGFAYLEAVREALIENKEFVDK